MAYDHSKKAGNLGDLWKHAVLISIAERMPVDNSFRYVETHSGAPIHTLGDIGEWRRGIGAVLDEVDPTSHSYLQQAKYYIARHAYPAGWLFFAINMAPRVKLLSVTLHDTAEAVAERYKSPLRELMPTNVESIFRMKDGYSVLEEIEADLVFLDPPYAPDDWGKLSQACQVLKDRQISFVAWYPIFWPTRPSQLIRETSLLGWEVMWREFGAKSCQNMTGCGMLLSDDLASVIEPAQSELEIVARLAGADEGVLIRTPA